MKTTLLPVQYCHTILYSGLNPRLTDSRMTLRIEQISDKEFLVTKSVCSPNDQFTRLKGRALADQKAMVHHSCEKNSVNYGPNTKLSGTIYCPAEYLDSDNARDVSVHYIAYEHFDRSRQKTTRVAYKFMFSDSMENPRDSIEIIMNCFRNSVYTNSLDYK